MIREVLLTLVEIWRRPHGKSVLLGLGGVFAVGTVFYRIFEGWSWLDSFYFTVVTLTTVGYGDLSPSGPFSRAFTIVLILTGVGYVLAFLNFLVARTAERRRKGLEQ